MLFLASPLRAQVVATYDFEDGTAQGWSPFGSPTLANAMSPVSDPDGGSHALLVTNRTSGFMGPSIDLVKVHNIVAGATYQVTAYVLLTAPDSSNPTATISTKTDGLRHVGDVRQSCDIGAAVEYSVDEGAGHFQLQQSARPAYEPDAVLPVEQRDGFVLHRRCGDQPRLRLRRQTPASRTTPVSHRPSRTADWMDGVRVRAVRR